MEQKPKTWIKYILSRIAKNKNFLAIATGQTGSGKSYSCLSIAEQLDKEFNIDRIVFSAIECLHLIKSGKLKKGSVIVYEEGGVNFSSKTWQSQTNINLGYLFQTFRSDNYIVLFNSPDTSFLDSTMRKLFHAEFTTTGIDYTTNECLLKAILFQWNARYNKMYFHRLKGLNSKGQYVPINIWRVNKPSQTLIEQYEIKKKQFNDKIKEIAEQKIKEQFEKDKPKDKEMTDNQKQVFDLLCQGNSIIDISKMLNRHIVSVYQSVRSIRKRGYELKPIRNEQHHIKKYEVYKDGVKYSTF